MSTQRKPQARPQQAAPSVARERDRDTPAELNPALVPEPEPTELPAATYRVSGTQPVLGHAPGATFTTTLARDQERFYLDGGHLTKQDAAAT